MSTEGPIRFKSRLGHSVYLGIMYDQVLLTGETHPVHSGDIATEADLEAAGFIRKPTPEPGEPVCHCRKVPCECPMDVEFGCDPEDSAALEKLRMAIDDHLLWTSDEASEAGDYEACVRYSGELARKGKNFDSTVEYLQSALTRAEGRVQELEAERDLYELHLQHIAGTNGTESSSPRGCAQSALDVITVRRRRPASAQVEQKDPRRSPGDDTENTDPSPTERHSGKLGTGPGHQTSTPVEHRTANPELVPGDAGNTGAPISSAGGGGEVGPSEADKGDCCIDCIGYKPIDRMVVCRDCGNKRCPRATNHRLVCTGSNEPGQPGSWYGGQGDAPAGPSEADKGTERSWLIERTTPVGPLWAKCNQGGHLLAWVADATEATRYEREDWAKDVIPLILDAHEDYPCPVVQATEHEWPSPPVTPAPSLPGGFGPVEALAYVRVALKNSSQASRDGAPDVAFRELRIAVRHIADALESRAAKGGG